MGQSPRGGPCIRPTLMRVPVSQWDEVKTIGCGWTNAPSKKSFPSNMVVCQYGPPNSGNIGDAGTFGKHVKRPTCGKADLRLASNRTKAAAPRLAPRGNGTLAVM